MKKFLIILNLLMTLMCNSCWANSEVIVEYMIDNNNFVSSIDKAKDKVKEYTSKTGKYLETPFAYDKNQLGDKYFLYSYDEAEGMGYTLCCYGINALDYSGFIQHPTEDFLNSNSTYYMKFSNSNNTYIEYDGYDKSLIRFRSDREKNILLNDDSWNYYIDNYIISLLKNSTITKFLAEKGIYANVIKAQLIYSVYDWQYDLNNEPIIWIKTNCGNYYLANLFEHTYKEQGGNPKDLISNTHSNIKIYNQTEAIQWICSKKGKITLNDIDISNKVRPVFSNKTVTVPLREFAECIGYSVEWNSIAGTVNLKSDKSEILFKPDIWSFGYNGIYIDEEGNRQNIESIELIHNNSIYMYGNKIYITNDVINKLSNLINYDINTDYNNHIIKIVSRI